jgi:hypothetical protein
MTPHAMPQRVHEALRRVADVVARADALRQRSIDETSQA